MAQSELAGVIEEYHRTIDAIVTGDPEPQKRLWSRGDDVTLANPLGPPVPGWGQVMEYLEQAASTAREGEPLRYESTSEYSTGDLGYNVELEWTRAKFGGAEDMTPVSLRATTIFRREEGEWKIVHRHADPITTTQPAESIIQQ
jgi:ketosteroid isomerase-like protein